MRLARWAPVAGAIAMALVIGGFYLFREYVVHGEPTWLYLLLLACPVIHLLAHNGYHGLNSKRQRGLE